MAIKMTKDEKKISVDLTVPGTLSMHSSSSAARALRRGIDNVHAAQLTDARSAVFMSTRPARSAVASTTCMPRSAPPPAPPCSCRRAPRSTRTPTCMPDAYCLSPARSAVFMSTRTAQHQDANVHAGCVLSLASPLGRVHVDARHAARALHRGLDNVHAAQPSAVFMSTRTAQHQHANVHAGFGE
jgi:hypothetical protein